MVNEEEQMGPLQPAVLHEAISSHEDAANIRPAVEAQGVEEGDRNAAEKKTNLTMKTAMRPWHGISSILTRKNWNT